MDKKYVIYRPNDKIRVKWPREILTAFADHQLNKFPHDDRLCFEVNSEEANQFQEICKEVGFGILTVSKVRKISGKDLSNSPFYYLHLKEDKSYIEKYQDISRQTGLEKTHLTCQCDTAYQQTRKVTIDPEKSKPLDIKRWPYSKNIIIVSRKLKELLDTQDFTGFKFIPCLEIGKTYSSEEQQLEYISPHLVAEAPYFQLLVTEQPNKPPRVGTIDIGKRSKCDVCGSVSAFDPDFDLESWPYFEDGDLAGCDIQQANTVLSNNYGEFPYFTLPVISFRLLKFFIENKISGLATYYSEMNIKYEAVWIK